MGQLARALSDEPDARSTVPNVSVRVQGLPEDVQWIADALEIALPGVMNWHGFAEMDATCVIEVAGVGCKPKDRSGVGLG